MKIAYLINYPLNKYDGVIKKIFTQKNEWEKKGHIVKLYAHDKYSNNIFPEISAYSVSKFKYRFYNNVKLLKDIIGFKPDIVYFRFTLWTKTLSAIQKTFSNIVEVNTDDKSECMLTFKQNKSIKNGLQIIFNLFFRGLVLSKANGIISVTKEIANSIAFTKYNKTIQVCPNSIFLNQDLVCKRSDNPTTSLFFIGSPNQDWQGIDIIENISDKMSEYTFHIVGIKKQNKKNLFYHGFLNENQYLPIMRGCSICIGTLALHRKHMYEACPLKVREYIMRGFPIIIGYQDTAFLDENPEWVLKIDSNNIDFIILKNFIEKFKNTIVSNEESSKFVFSSVIEDSRLKYFKENLANNEK